MSFAFLFDAASEVVPTSSGSSDSVRAVAPPAAATRQDQHGSSSVQSLESRQRLQLDGPPPPPPLVLLPTVPPPPSPWPCVACGAFTRVLPDADALTGLALDVVPGKYEGGMKQWECTHDLVGWVGANAALLHGTTVLDIGCGAGIGGVAALAAGAAHVIFQDLNEAVLAEVTSRNIVANHGVDCLRRCSFVAGAWCAAVPEALRGGVDVAISSETLYAAASHAPLLALLRAALVPGTGIAVIATKRYYFGVGGGTNSFTAAATAAGFVVDTLASVETDVQRDLLRLRWG